jgi:FkbM family methyltransferase
LVILTAVDGAKLELRTDRLAVLARRLPAPVFRRLQRGRGLLNEARLSAEDAREWLATPGGVRRLPPLPVSALNALVARNEHGIYCVPAEARGVVPRTIRRGRVWERETIAFLCGIDGDVVHAGAFFGDFLPALARSRQAMVWAFEPNLENFRCASITIYLNGFENVTLIHAGLSDHGGEAFVTNGTSEWGPSGGVARLVFDDSHSRSREVVSVTTIDSAIPEDRHVGVVHLDVEGHEEQALLGARRTIERCRPTVLLETLPTKAWLAENLAGYRRAGRVDRNTIFRPQD